MILAFVYTEWQKGFVSACCLLLMLSLVSGVFDKHGEKEEGKDE